MAVYCDVCDTEGHSTEDHDLDYVCECGRKYYSGEVSQNYALATGWHGVGGRNAKSLTARHLLSETEECRKCRLGSVYCPTCLAD